MVRDVDVKSLLFVIEEIGKETDDLVGRVLSREGRTRLAGCQRDDPPLARDACYY